MPNIRRVAPPDTPTVEVFTKRGRTKRTCYRCNGSGTVYSIAGKGQFVWHTCPVCHGKGHID